MHLSCRLDCFFLHAVTFRATLRRLRCKKQAFLPLTVLQLRPRPLTAWMKTLRERSSLGIMPQPSLAQASPSKRTQSSFINLEPITSQEPFQTVRSTSQTTPTKKSSSSLTVSPSPKAGITPSPRFIAPGKPNLRSRNTKAPLPRSPITVSRLPMMPMTVRPSSQIRSSASLAQALLTSSPILRMA